MGLNAENTEEQISSGNSDKRRWLQYDEISNTIRRTMFSLVVYCLFCLLTLGAPDVLLIKSDNGVTIPFANVKVSFNAFLIVGAVLLIIITSYLHLFVTKLLRFTVPDRSLALPYFFTGNGWCSRTITIFLFNYLTPLMLLLFIYKAGPNFIVWVVLCIAFTLTSTSIILIVLYRNYKKREGAQGLRLKLVNIIALKPIRLWIVAIPLVSISALTAALYYSEIFRRNINLQRVDLSAQYLAGKNLTNIDMSESNFNGTVLKKANLSYSNLKETTFVGANLNKALFNYAKVAYAQFTCKYSKYSPDKCASLRYANFDGARLNSANFAGADLASVRFNCVVKRKIKESIPERISLVSKSLELSDPISQNGASKSDKIDTRELDNAQLEIESADYNPETTENNREVCTVLAKVKFNGATLFRAQMIKANLTNAKFNCRKDSKGQEHCVNLQEAKLNGANLSRAQLVNADLGKARFNCTVNTSVVSFWIDVVRYGCANLQGAKFSGANFKGTELIGAKMTKFTIDKKTYYTDLRRAINLKCSQLKKAENWQDALRDKACGAPIPIIVKEPLHKSNVTSS